MKFPRDRVTPEHEHLRNSPCIVCFSDFGVDYPRANSPTRRAYRQPEYSRLLAISRPSIAHASQPRDVGAAERSLLAAVGTRGDESPYRLNPTLHASSRTAERVDYFSTPTSCLTASRTLHTELSTIRRLPPRNPHGGTDSRPGVAAIWLGIIGRQRTPVAVMRIRTQDAAAWMRG